MTREEKCKLAIKKGFIYNPETGEIMGPSGRIIIGKHSAGYISIQLYKNNKPYRLFGHIFSWYVIHKEIVEQIDHINGIKDDNRICNLRAVTNHLNQYNKLNVKGYSWNKRENKWRVYIGFDNKQIHLGYFDNEEDAREAYLKAKEKYHIIKNPQS